LDFSFDIHSEYEEAYMENIVHLLEMFKTIFLFKIFELGKAIFEMIENTNDLNRFEFEFKLNLTHVTLYPGPARQRLASPARRHAMCMRAARARRPQVGAGRRPPR
jgi:hypothetical protein